MTTVTDEMTGAAIGAVWEAVKTDNPPDGWTDWIDDRVMRAALEAAISVMPAPADAEFAAGLFSLSGSATRYGAETMSPRDDTDEWRAVLDALNTEVVEKRRTLLAMHAQARLAGLDDIRLDIHARGFNAGWREALEQLQESIIESSIKPENEFARGMQCADALVIQQIDTMLGGSHE